MDTHSNFAVSGSISSSSLTGDLGIFAVNVSTQEIGKLLLITLFSFFILGIVFNINTYCKL